MMDYLEKVQRFRHATGLDAGQSVELHNKLIREELAELADALADSLFVLCGKYSGGYMCDRVYSDQVYRITEASNQMGIILPEAFRLVYESNMSKLCMPSEIDATRRKYNEIGVAVEFRQIDDNTFACYSKGGRPDYPEGKLLKSVGYHEPRWHETDVWMAEWRR